MSFELGAGARAGVARVSGQASSGADALGASVAGVWGAPLVFAGLGVPLAGPFRLSLDAEVGYVVSPVRGRVEAGDDVEVDELWTALGLGGRRALIQPASARSMASTRSAIL
jgi:hypothetical protein